MFSQLFSAFLFQKEYFHFLIIYSITISCCLLRAEENPEEDTAVWESLDEIEKSFYKALMYPIKTKNQIP